MQDFKHLTKKKSLFRSKLSRRHQKYPPNTFKSSQTENKPARKRLRLILPVLAVLLAAYPIVNLLVTAKSANSSVTRSEPQQKENKGKLTAGDTSHTFQLAADCYPRSSFTGDQLKAQLSDGSTVVYAVNQELQQHVKKVMADSRVPYGVFVAIEPKSGRILAMAAHSAISPEWEQNSYYSLYPMASLFKIITASAALEQNKVSPDTVMAFRGKLTSENPRLWYVKPGSRAQEMPLADAMGKSVNPVFGRLASEVVGKDSIVFFAERFGFNQTLYPGTPIIPSQAAIPQSDAELKLMGAGLCREVKISPLHAAAIMAAIANNGMMMRPLLADRIVTAKGESVVDQTQQLRRLVSPETASELTRMLLTTVNKGTSRKAFHDRRGRPKLAAIDIAAKTGSIDGKEPAGHYSWFAAYAPVDNPQIALAALVINQDKWKIKASYLGEQALEAFFR